MSLDQFTMAVNNLDPADYPQAAREIVMLMSDSQLLEHRLYCSDEEPKRRQREQDKADAQAETIQAVWDAHPEIKPKFETGAVEVTSTTKDGRITLAALLKAYPPFVQPTGAHDALPPGAQVSDEGRVWRNDLNKLNVWKPGTMNAGWTDITDMLLAEHNPPEPEEGDGQDADTAPGEAGVQEWAPGLNVKPGERYTFQGDTYEVIQGHTSASHWPPNAVPALYRKV